MKILKFSLVAALTLTSMMAESNTTAVSVKSNLELQKELAELKEKLVGVQDQLDTVQQHDAKDNIKFTMDFRNSYNYINYDYNNYKDWSGTSKENNGLYTSRVLLNMKSSPVKKLTFTGQLAAYALWGAHVYEDDKTLKGWSASSKAGDTLLRIRQAYFVYSDAFSNGLPYSFSVGRRQSTDGFLANFREGNENPGSPLAHITNMEVDGAMFKLDLGKYTLPGAFIKAVYGRAHSGGMQTLYDKVGYQPYAQDEEDYDENVDFLVLLGNIYDNGQYKMMFEHSTIFNTKGARSTTPVGGTLPDGHKNVSLDAGTAYLDALSFQMMGVGDMINDFLDSTTLFLSLARSQYSPESGHELLGSTSDEDGYSVWAGFSIPDMITERGKIGFEYNHGSQYWTPMTWAEDSVMGSKLAVRGDAYEAYWNFNVMGLKNLTGQLRYTYEQHDYTPNIRCSGWVAPEEVDIQAQNVRAFIRYQY